METKDLIIEKESRFDFDTTVGKLIELATARSWGNPANHDLQQTLAKSGKTVKPVKIIEICKPQYSGQMLEKNHERIAPVMMPCRISVYEKEDGKIYISMINGHALAAAMPPSTIDIMSQAALEIDEIVAEVILQSN